MYKGMMWKSRQVKSPEDMVVNEKFVGMLQVYKREPFYPDNDWIDFFETLAGQAAIQIDRWQAATPLDDLCRSMVEADLGRVDRGISF